MNKLRTKLPLQLTAGKQNRTLGNECLFYSIKNLQWSNPFKKRMTVIFFHSGLLSAGNLFTHALRLKCVPMVTVIVLSHIACENLSSFCDKLFIVLCT